MDVHTYCLSGGDIPWALQLASDCMDLLTGRITLWPRAGGWHDQDPLEIAAMRRARQVYLYHTYPKSRSWPGFEHVLLDIYEALEAEKTT